MTYAAGTSVDPSKTRSEIDALLTKNGATHVAIQSAPDSATVAFEIAGKRYRITLPMPTMEQCKPGNKIPPRWYGMQASQREEWVRGQRDQRLRERWRALFLLTPYRDPHHEPLVSLTVFQGPGSSPVVVREHGDYGAYTEPCAWGTGLPIRCLCGSFRTADVACGKAAPAPKKARCFCCWVMFR